MANRPTFLDCEGPRASTAWGRVENPWNTGTDEDGNCVYDEALNLVVEADDADAAKFICRACNSHDDILSALKLALDAMQFAETQIENADVLFLWRQTLSHMRASVERAGGGK